MTCILFVIAKVQSRVFLQLHYLLFSAPSFLFFAAQAFDPLRLFLSQSYAICIHIYIHTYRHTYRHVYVSYREFYNVGSPTSFRPFCTFLAERNDAISRFNALNFNIALEAIVESGILIMACFRRLLRV